MIAGLVGLFVSGFFAGAACYINVVEHAARLGLEDRALVPNGKLPIDAGLPSRPRWRSSASRSEFWRGSDAAAPVPCQRTSHACEFELGVDVARDHESEQGIDGNSPGGCMPRQPRLDRKEARRIASSDPLVQAGHLSVEVHPIQLEDLSSIRFDYPPLK